MRFTKQALTLTLIAGASLGLAACGGNKSASTSNVATTEVVATDNGAEDSMMGGMDGATGNAVIPETGNSSAPDSDEAPAPKAKPKLKATPKPVKPAAATPPAADGQ